MRVFEWTDEKRQEWESWLAGRPQVIRDMAASHPPNLLYRMQSTGQRVTLIAYSENRTCRVAVTGQYNFLSHDRNVFGVSIDDLVECDLPDAGEPLGTVLTGEEVGAAIAGGASPQERMERMRKAATDKLGGAR